MSNRVILVRHGIDPPDDRVSAYLSQNGFDAAVVRPFQGEDIGDTDDIAGAVLFGGPFNAFATDEHPFLKDEYHLIETCLMRGLPLLGICQGAQMIALHLGAEVGPKPDGRHEFGYYEITPTEAGRDFLPKPLHLVQAHFHTFGIPDGAEHLASSELFENQAFRYAANVYGLQFHAEVTETGFRRWQSSDWAAYGRPGAQTKEVQDQLMARHDAAQADWFNGFLAGLYPARVENRNDGKNSAVVNPSRLPQEDPQKAPA